MVDTRVTSCRHANTDMDRDLLKLTWDNKHIAFTKSAVSPCLGIDPQNVNSWASCGWSLGNATQNETNWDRFSHKETTSLRMRPF